jgi:DNA-binding HxlR family transcriptional regulator
MQANVKDEASICPIGRASELLGDRWTLLILREATLGVTRFDKFRERLGVADNILSTRLRRLVEADVLVKVPYHDGRRTRDEYRLTQAGADLAPALRALGEWADKHTARPAGTRPMRAVHTGCGGALDLASRCTRCGAVAAREQQAWLRPWASKRPFPLAAPWSS